MSTLSFILKRGALKNTYTISKLYANGVYLCDVLEDKVRDINKNGKFDNGEVKVYGETAIPYGTYEITITYSNRFKRLLPLLLNVPDFDGIRMHPGNTAEDTHGCLLVGKNSEIGKITESKKTFEMVFDLIQKAINRKDKVTITIQ